MPDFADSAVALRMREYQKDLLARDADTILHMGNHWLQVEQALEANISLLTMSLVSPIVLSNKETLSTIGVSIFT